MHGRDLFSKYKFLIKISIWFFKIFPNGIRLFFWNCTPPFSGIFAIGIRYSILKTMVKSCGDNIRIGSNVRILGWEHLDVEYNISIHDNCYKDATGGLTLENNVSIAHSSSILTTNHGWSDTTLPIKYNPITKSPVHIKSDVWVGCGCRILNGVIIYSRAVVAAGAVVNKDVEENSVYGGVPAKKIKDI